LIEQKATEQQGMVYEVKLDQGGSVSISQGIEPMLSVGQRVKVIHSAKERSRVLPE
jgi:outer membrane lipoprotein SlyB